MLRNFLLALALTWMPFGASGASADAPIVSFDVSPIFQFEIGEIHLVSRITPHRDNVQICWGWILREDLEPSKGYPVFRKSCQQLHGIYSPKVFHIGYQKMARGEYRAIVELYRAPSTVVAKLEKPFRVIESDVNNPPR